MTPALRLRSCSLISFLAFFTVPSRRDRQTVPGRHRQRCDSM